MDQRLLPGPLVLDPIAGVDLATAAFAYEGEGAGAVRRLKYADGRRNVGPLADLVVARIPPPAAGTVVTWVPRSLASRRHRSFDQAGLLARALGRRWRRPVRALLRRRPDDGQTGRTAAERRRGPALVARGRCPPHVLVVDDVCTTGSSLAAAAATLRGRGAETVRAVVLAHRVTNW